MCQNCDWKDFIEEIDDMLGSDEYDWASDTLSGIRDTVENMEHCTDNQKQAVENIANAGAR